MRPGLPTRSQLRMASFTHLGHAAQWWERLGATAESVFGELASAVPAPGGIDWQGAAGTAAAEHAATDLVAVRTRASAWSQAAMIARLGQDRLIAGTALALEAISDAERDGFAVGEDYSVTDARPASSREQQIERMARAQAHAGYIRHRVGALVAADTELSAQLKTATAGFGQLSFAGSGTDVQPVDNQIPPDASSGVIVCEPYTAGGGFMCWEWFMDARRNRSWWSPRDLSVTP
ncbi:hypothetical protein [Mycobacterium sp.]|uniref:hypothetical protein n=1 Tax=Mycobacterium sp. TaxID=1785 RepID=UPI00127120B1|nr:hypothetical protein [Mycobacterium sp.]KAA8958685.1 MAG: hypothetical protein F6Q13_15285 [Mycobacterium sp.]